MASHEHQAGHGPSNDHGHSAGMGSRGITRPMAEMESHDSEPPHGGHGGHHGNSHDVKMSDEDRRKMLHMHHKQTLWVYWTVITLGIWLIVAPFTFGYLDESQWVDPSGGRGIWFSDETHTSLRAWLMTWSDVLTGVLLAFFGWRSLTPNRPISLWTCCFLGIWLTFAPVVLWSPSAAAYLNDTIVGALVMALTVLIPGMPNMIMYMQMGGDTPPGWSYNPSSWPQRWIMIATGLAGWLVSRYLAAFQLGYVQYVWDPFFGFESGTKQVLNSQMSHAWPISDAALGALSYTFEFLMGFMGSPARWRTMPWMVAFFGILVIPLGLTHIILVISQPVIVHHWCTMCLLAAAIMLPMIPLEVDEVVAMGQHMVEAKRRGDHGGSLWQIFWKGGSAEGCNMDDRSPELMAMPQAPGKVLHASIWGMSFPGTLVLSSVLGLWLMALPSVFNLDIRSTAADVGHLGGALIITVSVISMGEVVRIGRYLNVVLGLGVAIVPWIVASGGVASAVAMTVTGIVVALLAMPRSRKSERYGLWDRFVR